jgi:hypothetical protein
MSKFKFRRKKFSWIGYFYLATGMACLLIAIQKIVIKDPLWKIAVVLGISLVILLITWRKYSK